MPLYDSAVHAFGTAGTGGFGIWGDSIAHYDSAYIDVVLGVGMVLFGVNFNIYYLLLMGKLGSILKSEELRWYLGIITGSTLLIAWNTRSLWGSFLQSLRYAFFQSGIWPLNENYWRESYYTGENDPCYILWLEPSAWAEEALAQAGIMVPEEPGLYYKDDTNQLTLVRELTG